MQATREYLQTRLGETRQELGEIEERLKAKGDYGPGTGDPLVTRWELNLARKEFIEQKVSELEYALSRLEKGDYGICETCGQPIAAERLEALPRTTMCIRCARKTE
jgi:DnaK suppressor protein